MSEGITVPDTGIAIRVTNGSSALASPRRSPFHKYSLPGAYLALFAIGYYFTAGLGLGLRFQHSQIGVIWPANALLLSALVLSARKRWWLVLLVASIAHLVALARVVPLWRMLWQIGANTLFTTVTAEQLRRFAGLPLHFGNRRQIVTYIAISFALPLLFAPLMPSFVRSLLHLEPTTPSTTLLRITLTNATALLSLAPVVLLWAQRPVVWANESSLRELGAAAIILVSLLVVSFFAFNSGVDLTRFPSLLLWFFPPLLWAAVRFGPLGASTSLLVVVALSFWGTARQLGPFVVSSNSDEILSLQLFWIVLCIPVMLLAAVIRERELVEEALEEQREQLAHLTRVATAGELSGALAHELSQPLAAILANAQAAVHVLATDPENVSELREILADITAEDRQAVNIIDHLRSFMKEGESHFERLAIENVVCDALALARSTIEISGVDVQIEIAAEIPRVRGDAVQLLQVVLNLIVNGCESMSSVAAPDRHLILRVEGTDRDQVEIQIADHGVGLPKGYEERVFEPFFTTKRKGLGLGLAICRSIATAHRGRLWAANNPDGGATFHFVLPTEKAHGSTMAAA